MEATHVVARVYRGAVQRNSAITSSTLVACTAIYEAVKDKKNSQYWHVPRGHKYQIVPVADYPPLTMAIPF